MYIGTQRALAVEVSEKEVREKLFCGREVTLKIKGIYGSHNTDFELAEIVDARPRARKYKHYICKECGYDFGYTTEKLTTCLCCDGKLEYK